MPPKRKKANTGLPARWRFRHGAYTYRVPPGQEHRWDGKKEFRLGATLAEAYRAWAERIETADKVSTMPEAFDRFVLEYLPNLRPATQTDYRSSIKRLRAAFRHFKPSDVKPADAKDYYQGRVKAGKGAIAAKHDVEVLRTVLTQCVEWRVIERNELIGQLRMPKAVRTRDLEDWELAQIRKLGPGKPGRDTRRQMIAYVEIKLLTGLRRYDMLMLGTPDRYVNGIPVTTSKTGKRLIINMTPELHRAMLAAQEARPVNISPWLFCDAKGGCYMRDDGTAPAFKTRWQRFVKQVMDETTITERFQESDLRARAAHDAGSVEDAQALLGHASSETTQRIYRRAPQRVKPTK